MEKNREVQVFKIGRVKKKSTCQGNGHDKLRVLLGGVGGVTDILPRELEYE